MTHLSPETWDAIIALRHKWQERSEADQPDYLTEAIDDDGSVRIRPMTLTDVLEWVERVCEGDVS